MNVNEINQANPQQSTQSLQYVNVDTSASNTSLPVVDDNFINNAGASTTYLPLILPQQFNDDHIDNSKTSNAQTSTSNLLCVNDDHQIHTSDANTSTSNLPTVMNKTLNDLLKPFYTKSGNGLGSYDNSNSIVLRTWNGFWIGCDNHNTIFSNSDFVRVNEKWILIYNSNEDLLSFKSSLNGKYLTSSEENNVFLRDEISNEGKFKYIFTGLCTNGNGTGEEVGGLKFLSLVSSHGRFLSADSSGFMTLISNNNSTTRFSGWNY